MAVAYAVGVVAEVESYQPGLNQTAPLSERVGQALRGASRLHVGVAYAKTSGVTMLLANDVPKGSRAVVGLGFGLTDPIAVEQLDQAGLDVRVVPDQDSFIASAFHPKLYLIQGDAQLTTFSASANLTGGGWTTNIEQYEELTFADPSAGASAQYERYERLWEHGVALDLLRRDGAWERYRQRAYDRRVLEREDRRRVLRLQARTGQLIGALARRSLRAAPGYLAVTNGDWWQQQLWMRNQTDVALFWRRNTNAFRALAAEGVLVHLVKDAMVAEEFRSVRGFSVYRGHYEVRNAAEAFRVHGASLGVGSLQELYERLSLPVGAEIGIIFLHDLTEFERPVPLEELRANDVPFARNIVSGRRLTLTELATVFELGGLGVPEALAAEETQRYRP